jgi:VanZ family protein
MSYAAVGAGFRLLLRPAAAPLRVAAPVLWAVMIWRLSASPGGSQPSSFLRSFLLNGAHAGLFGALTALLLFVRPSRILDPRWGLLCAALAVAYGVLDEVHQGYVPGRHPSVLDVVTDACGALAAVSAVSALASGRRRPWLLCGVAAALAMVSSLVETLG